MNVLSLFDGAACAMVCLKRAGIPIGAYYSSEIKKCAIRCEELLSGKLGVNQIQLGDVTKIDYSQLPKIDLLCAGFPCQDYSVANSRKQGINGKNGQLFWEVVRAIKAVHPKYIILENVSTIPPATLALIQRKKIEKVFNAGYDAFRCPTQAELARFHTYPVDIMEQFSPPQAQSLMGDGWHCGSIQWLFDKLKTKIKIKAATMKNKENTPKTLHLVLKSKWFDKIASGKKTSEYRECKPYWNKRLSDFWNLPDIIKPRSFDRLFDSHKYDRVIFHRGYTTETMEFEILSIGITRESNDLNLPQCWEIKLGQRM